MPAGISQLYIGNDGSKAFVFDDSVFTDDGNNIETRIRTKEYYLSGPDKMDEIKYIYVYADVPQATNFSISLDGGDYEYLGQITATDEPQRFDIYKKCFHFSLGLDEMSGSNIQIKGFNVWYEPLPTIM